VEKLTQGIKMPSIVLTTTKSASNVPWVNTSKTDYSNISESDYKTYITPYWNFVRSLTGFQSITNSVTDTTATVTISFDTSDNANNALVQIANGSNQVVANRNTLYRQTMDKMGVSNNYSYMISINQ